MADLPEHPNSRERAHRAALYEHEHNKRASKLPKVNDQSQRIVKLMIKNPINWSKLKNITNNTSKPKAPRPTATPAANITCIPVELRLEIYS